MDEFITFADLKKYVPYSKRHLYRLEASGDFPRRLRVGPKKTVWLLSAIVAWIEKKKEQHQ